MEDLKAFLYGEEKLPKEKEIAVSKRFLSKDGKPLLWKIKALKEREHQKIKQTQQEGAEKYWGRLCAASVVQPNLEDKGLLESYQCTNAEELLKEMLTMGEYMTLLGAVQQQNQFQQRKEALKKEVKKP